MKRYGLLGKKLSHSFSRQYFTEKFEKDGIIDSTYELFELDQCRDFENFLHEEPTLCGLNVTIPYKEEIIPFLDELDPAAAAIGAVNTIKFDSAGKTTGYNTDYYGFKNSIKPFLNNQHERALILGTGGASKAVQQVLKELNINYLVASRNPNEPNEIGYDDVNEYIIMHHKLIINTTPLGMHPDTFSFPNIPYQYLSNQHLLCDLVYNPEETIFLKEGKKRGCLTLNGMSMLRLQAEKSWEIWQH